MTQPRLPDGFAVQVDRRVRVLGAGSALLGGSPTRLLRPAGGPSHRDVTIVVPVRDNMFGLRRLLRSLRGLRVIVVDDGSAIAVQQGDFSGLHCQVEVITHARSKGPAAARNTGLAACATDFVAFLDSDVVPRRGWLEALLGHFSDPAVALVAPRIVGLAHSDNLVARYEAVRSSLDLGRREAPVVPYGTVSYVPSAAIICRRSALTEMRGFDETLDSGEDVDLCWRLVESGVRLRYEPIALVAHDHRTDLRDWLVRKAFYGQSAAPLAVRHPDKTAPLVISGWTLVLWLLLAMGSGMGYLASMVIAALSARRIANTLDGVDSQPRDVAVVAARGLVSAALQLASAICRHYWPIALLAALLFRRCRQIVLIAAVVDGVVDWLSRHRNTDDETRQIGLLGYLVLKRLDDIAYGAGMWTGMVRERNLRPLKPQIRA
jgi:mycofactocin glycosyltransferase